ncbi:kinase-like domain-containing protein [Dunaliella salina]|uniref:non-specific serine/threonine protein kinase n=1 Tax=Dunaliella salina TaxID=3046 RepID=A0ABQ7GY41_DUNSA|nr:kinase-like domain-containing protein [Dunaliella salina]|eukprot:KAF5839520.1 kinase-like domain-containing protein [Dunaliella salina]
MCITLCSFHPSLLIAGSRVGASSPSCTWSFPAFSLRARECILTKSHLGLAMEYASGGNLTEYVTDKWESTPSRNGLFLAEDEARYFFKQFLSAVEYLHANHVAHRDLKLDNIVLNKSDPPSIKLCDFGFAKNWEDQSNMYTQIGTPVYMSPQLINSKTTDKGYDAQKADVWACGILLFVMMLGMFPFEHSDHPDPNSSQAHAEVWLQQIKTNWREAPRIAESAKKLSPECQDLLDKMFDLDEEKRISIREIRAHPWYNKPMAPKFVHALDKLKESQENNNNKLEAGVYQSEARIVALQSLVEKAGNKGGVDEEVVRVPLARVKLGDAAGGKQVEGNLEAPSMKVIEE